MANLQYVGARYVPKFYENSLDPSSPEWEAGVGYEGMTVVTYLGDSYTSKIPVPGTVGNPAANRKYWAKTGEFNAAILALQGRMTTAENDIDNLEADVPKREFNLANKRYVLIGDSLGTGTYSGNADGGWCNYFKSKLGLTEGIDVFTTAINGKGWSTSGTNFLTMAQNLVTTDDNTITDVIVLGGLNDYQESFNDEFVAANNLYNYLHNRFPIASIRFGVIGRSRDNAAVNTGLEERIIPAIMNSKAIYIDGSDNFGRWYDRYMDTWHWDDNYTEVFANLLVATLGTKIEVNYGFRSTSFTPDSEFGTATNPILKMRQKGNMILIPNDDTNLFQYTVDKAFTGGNWLDIVLGTLQSNIAGDGSSLIPVTGYIGFSAPNHEFMPYTGHLAFNAGTDGNSIVHLYIGGVFPGDTGYVSRTVHNFTINVPETAINAAYC